MSVPDAGSGIEGAAPPAGILVQVFARTDVGLLREHNEDDFLVADLTRRARTLMPDVQAHALGPGGSVFVVCDGMGGAAAGEVASRTAVDTIFERLSQGDPPPDGVAFVARLDEAIIDAGRRIYQMARADQERRGMGTTCTAAVLRDRRLYVAQVGDSRCYVFRHGVLRQLTRDQSLLTQLIEAGQVRPEDAANFEHSNIILQALGTTEMVNTDVTFHDLGRGDIILLCSDGLSGMVSDEAIREILVAHPEPLAACRALTDAANHGGGEDNITVVVARFDGPGLPEPAAGQRVVFERFAKRRPAQFDRVPYTIPEQEFEDGGPAIPSAPEVPLGAVYVGDVEAGVSPPHAPAEPAVPEAAAAPADAAHAPHRPAGPVEAAFDGTGSSLDEALRGAADAPRVIEWSDEDVPLDTLPSKPPAAEAPRPVGRGWAAAALLLLALVIALLVYDSLRSGDGTGNGPAAGSADVLPVPPPGAPRGRPLPPAADPIGTPPAEPDAATPALPPISGGSVRVHGGGGVPGITRMPSLRPAYPGERADPTPRPAPPSPPPPAGGDAQP